MGLRDEIGARRLLNAQTVLEHRIKAVGVTDDYLRLNDPALSAIDKGVLTQAARNLCVKEGLVMSEDGKTIYGWK